MKLIDASWSGDDPRLIGELEWPAEKYEEAYRCPIFTVNKVTMRRPRSSPGQASGVFNVLESGDFVNIFALTSERRLVVIEQYRFGSRRVTLETPGGFVDPGEKPLDAAKRELLEETGFTSNDFRHLATLDPNPAVQSNRMHFFLALGAEKTSEQELDDNEVLNRALVDWNDFETLVTLGRITHCLVLTGYVYARMHMETLFGSGT